MLKVYYGRENVQKENFIFDQIKDRAIILVPDQFTLELERDLFDYIGAKALINVEVLSISRLANRLIETFGGKAEKVIDKYGRHMILSEIARAEKASLTAFASMATRQSFAEKVNDFISEMKQYGCGMDELEKIIEKTPESSYTRKKLSDLALLYGKYEERIAGKFTDSEDYIDLYKSKIKDSELIRGNDIWVYGFDSFAPKTLGVIKELAAYADSVNVVLSWDKNANARDAEIFELTKKVINNLSPDKIAEIPSDYAIEKPAALKALEQEIYALPEKPFTEKTDCIHLVASTNEYLEAETAASYVLSLIRDKGYRLRDIRVICNDLGAHEELLKRAFSEYGLKLESDSLRRIIDRPEVRFALAVLDAVIYKMPSDKVIEIAKSGLAGLSYEEAIDLENYAIKFKIHHSMWEKPFTKGAFEYKTKEEADEALARLNDLRVRAIEPIKFVRDLAESADTHPAACTDAAQESTLTVGEFVRGFAQFLEETLEGAESLGSVLAILAQVENVLADQEFDLRRFKEIFEIGLSEVREGVLPKSRDGLILGTIERTRIGKAKVLVVIGATEGMLPKAAPSAGLFAPDEKDLFESSGISICKVDGIKILEEKLAIYRNLSAPTDELFVSYSGANESGEKACESEIFTKLRTIFERNEVEGDIAASEDSLRFMSSSISTLRYLTAAIRRATLNGELTDEAKAAIAWYEAHKPDEIARIKAAIAYDGVQAPLGKELALKLFATEEGLTVSPSKIEKYAKCPFEGFIEYGLKPEERRIYEIEVREIGDIYHEALMTLANDLTLPGMNITDPRSPWMKADEKSVKAKISDIIGAISEQYKEGLFKNGAVEDYRVRRITDACGEAAWAMVLQVQQGTVESAVFEAQFGRQKTAKFKAIEKEIDGIKVRIEGKIDRADTLPDDRIRIIDYKTGKAAKYDTTRIKSGYSMQLMIYMQAATQEGKKPAGLYYFKIADELADIKDIAKADASEKRINSMRLNGVTIDDPMVIKNTAGDFQGNSFVVQLKHTKGKEVEPTAKSEKTKSLLTDLEFADLKDQAMEAVYKACEDMINGKIEIHPMKTADDQDASECKYCKYKSICRFDTIFDGNAYNMIK